MKKLFYLYILLFLAYRASAQVSIAPTTLFTDANGIGTLYVSNGSETPQEVNISFLFGYPGSDSLGNVIMIYNDSITEGQYGLTERVRTFPKSFILAPGQQQTVRVQVRPDRTKPAGTYFTRVKILSNAQTADIGQTNNAEITTQVTFQFEQVIAMFYKSGSVSTGLDFKHMDTEVTSRSIVVDSEYAVSGNSPYLGSFNAVLKDDSGKILKEQQQTIALYFQGKRSFGISLPEDIRSGNYTLEVLFKTERSDIPSADLVQSTPVNKKFTVQVL
jgi:P pilus assembly chaperone PapD